MSEVLSEEQLITYDELVTAIHAEVRNQDAEQIRRNIRKALDEDAMPLEELKARHGDVWTTDELRQQFEVVGFGAPLVVVRRRCDNKLGSLFFQGAPRFYWGFKEDRV